MQPYRLQAVRNVLHAVIRGGTWIAATALVLMTLVTAVNVVARYIARRPLAGAVEIGSLLLVVTVFLGIAYTEVNKQHVTFREVVDRFPRRAKVTVMRIMYFIATAFFLVLGWRAVLLAIDFIKPITRSTDVIHIPIFPVIFIIALGSVLLALELLLNCISPLPPEEEDKERQSE